MKLQRKSKFSGAYDQYSFNRIIIDHNNSLVEATIACITLSESGVPDVDIQTYNINNSKASSIVDPAWSASSTPAKPDNFDLNDISTWGSITYDQIPLIADPSVKYYDIIKRLIPLMSIEDAVLNVLTSNGALPLENDKEDGWKLM